MKILSSLLTPQGQRNTKALFLSPYLSPRSLRRSQKTDLGTVLLILFLSLLMTLIFIFIAHTALAPLSYGGIVFLCPIILFFTEFIGALGQLIFWPFTKDSFSIHLRPLSSNGLSEFWGKHWNLWVQDWLKDMGRFFRDSRANRLLGIFLISGLFHELMVNLPYWLVYRKSYFGTMMAYFICQAIGVEIEKRFLRHRPVLIKRAYMLLVVALPSPLFLNIPVLTFLGLL